MKKLLLLLLPIITFSQTTYPTVTKSVGINTTAPTAIFDNTGDTRLRVQPTGLPTDSIMVSRDGFVKKIKNTLGSGSPTGLTTTITVNQNNFVRLQGTEVLGRLWLNNQITINPTNTTVVKPTNSQPLTDWNLAGRLLAGTYNLDLEIRLFQQNLNKSSYIILRTISETGEVFDSEMFVIPSTLDVGIELPLNFRVKCPVDCMVQVYRVGQNLPNNIGLKWIKIR